MATDTDLNLRKWTLYCAYVRAHGAKGAFEDLTRDLARVRALGVDALWLLPIHPIGLVGRLGALGSPYAIADYRAINPELGTREDFLQLVEAAHALGMKVLMDVVYNHTSPDSRLRARHPEWFYRRPDGNFGNRAGEWPDVIDLDYSQRALWDHQIETLVQWARVVDGFRCDVAPLLPLAFWLEARRRVAEQRPGCVWLCESVEPAFTRANRERGMESLSDCELYQAFDVSYDYDIYGDFHAYAMGECPLSRYVEALERQETAYPANYVKLRFLENHDRARAAFLFPDQQTRLNWTCWLYFQRGMTLLYAGQECEAVHRPSLFEREPIPWQSCPQMEALLPRLHALKQDERIARGALRLSACPRGLLKVEYALAGRKLLALFSLKGRAGHAPVSLADGEYPNLLFPERPARVESGRLLCDGLPLALDCEVRA